MWLFDSRLLTGLSFYLLVFSARNIGFPLTLDLVFMSRLARSQVTNS